MFLTHTADAVTTLTLNRPPVNAISEEWVRAFDAKLDDLARGPRFTVLHIRSEQKVFCAGADLKEVQERMDAADGPDRMYSYVAGIQRLYARIERLPQVTLAEIGGAAMGGGFELALACDLRIAANEAKVGLPEVRLGLIPGAGGTQRLTRLCGPALASRLILGAEILDGAAASALRRGALGGAARRNSPSAPPNWRDASPVCRPRRWPPARPASRRPATKNAAASPTNWISPGGYSPMPRRVSALRRFLRARPKPRNRRKKGRHDDIRWQGSIGHRRRLRHRQGDGDGFRPPGRDGDLRRRERHRGRGVEEGSFQRQPESRFRRHRHGQLRVRPCRRRRGAQEISARRHPGERRRLGRHPALHAEHAGVHQQGDRHQPRGPGASDAGAAAADDRRQRRQDRQYRQRRRPRRQRRRDGLRRRQRRADRLHQVARARGRPLLDQRQLRVPGPDRHADARHALREAARGLPQGDPVPPLRQAGGNRRRRRCFSPARKPTTSPAR